MTNINGTRGETSMRQVSEVVFIDPTVARLDDLASGLRPDVEAVIIDGSEPAIRQMARALTGRTDLSAIHILAHGDAGEVSFGSGRVSLENLPTHAADLAAIGRSLGEEGGIRLWTCRTGEGARGAAFVAALSRATGAEVAAATGLVGSSELGGRWALDISTAVDAPLPPLTLQGIDKYVGVMPAPSITQVTDDVAPITGTIANGGTTNDSTPTVRVSLAGTGAVKNDTVQLYDGATLLGTVTLTHNINVG